MIKRHRHRGLTEAILVAILGVSAGAPRASAQTFTSLVSFSGTNGSQAAALLVQGFDGNLYGVAYGGGNVEPQCSTSLSAAGCGTVFKVTPAGVLTTLHAFCAQSGCTDGVNPTGLAAGTDGNLYGTTASGGSSGKGTVFRITPTGTLTTLHNFAGTDGAGPAGTLAGPPGTFYGVTAGGGTNSWGTVFKITTSGTFTSLFDFNLTNGGSPESGLVQGTDGNFYGTTYSGGTSTLCLYGCGTVFKITPAGVLTTLHSFIQTDGEAPFGPLVQGTDGNFYGTTTQGGLTDCSSLDDGCGTVFKITSTGTLTTLVDFDSTNGGEPSGVFQATDGKFYGTTVVGGSSTACDYGCGTLYNVTSTGTLTTLHNFAKADGAAPGAPPFQSTNGTLYGPTQSGGSKCTPNGCGTVYSLSVSLGTFVETLPTSGNVGAAVIILGTNLKGSTSVTFNGTAATFTVVSGTEIKTTVPKGATTGKVQVTTPGGVLTSNVSFRVP